MPFNPDRHDRQSIRPDDYDYASEGAYFITICAFQRECLFGEVVKDGVFLNTLGCVVETDWVAIADHFEHVIIDEFVIMPNHLHGILVLDYSGSVAKSDHRRNLLRSLRTPMLLKVPRPVLSV